MTRRLRSEPGDFADRPRTLPGRAPDTIDECPAVAIGSDRAELDADFYDREPRTRDLEARVAALEQGVRRKSLVRTWLERAASFLSGSALVGLAWMLTKAEERGDARRSSTTLKAEHAQMLLDVQALKLRDALQQGQIDGLADRLRYPMQGPPIAPRTDP